MDIQIVPHIKEKIQVIIKCKEIDNEVIRLKSHIELFDTKLQAKRENNLHLIKASDVLYFEAVDNKTFVYTEDDVMEMKQRLYELEAILSEKDFIRTSKSQIININKIKTLKPELNRTILATMCNNEQLYISRKYVPSLKSILSIQEKKL